jgi:hypothetical protein
MSGLNANLVTEVNTEFPAANAHSLIVAAP